MSDLHFHDYANIKSPHVESMMVLRFLSASDRPK